MTRRGMVSLMPHDPDRAPVGCLSIWDPIHLGIDEAGHQVSISLIERNLLIGGEPGAGKSNALNLIVAHAALSIDCRLVLVDGKQVELGPWRESADLFVGPDPDEAITVLRDLRTGELNARYDRLVSARPIQRKIRRDGPDRVIVIVVDELAYFSATAGTKKQQEEFTTLLRDLVARGRAAGFIMIVATQRPSADVVPTSFRDLFGYRWAFRCSTGASSDTILGHGWANRGYTATDIDPLARGVGWLLAEGGTPGRVKAVYLTDSDVDYLAMHATRCRRPGGAAA
jgi:DNA segregation ATPase FtsK/SpoIIIE, S-DNA-T family